MRSASGGSSRSRKSGLLRRSGLTSSTSTEPVRSASSTASHSSVLAELMVWARDAGARRRLDLVAHQRQQRRHDERRPGALRPQQPGGHEVDRRLPPPGALHDEGPPVLDDERLDRRPLVVAQRHVVAPDERPQDLLGVGSHADGPYRGGVTFSLRAARTHCMRSAAQRRTSSRRLARPLLARARRGAHDVRVGAERVPQWVPAALSEGPAALAFTQRSQWGQDRATAPRRMSAARATSAPRVPLPHTPTLLVN